MSHQQVNTGGAMARAAITWVTLALIVVGSTQAQQIGDAHNKFVPQGWSIEETMRGDLTGDTLDDVVLMLIDTREQSNQAEENGSRMLVVLARKADGSFEQIGVNTTLLLCRQCFGAMGGGPEITINNRVLIVDQLVGSRFTDQGVWRFRFDSQDHKMRLIGLDITHMDRGEGSGTVESTNYLTGKRITETYGYDEQKQKGVLMNSRTTSVAVTKIFLEQATSQSLQ